MHTIRKVDNNWMVQFVESGSDPGYRPTRDNICSCPNPYMASVVASWLNGGLPPDGVPSDKIKWMQGKQQFIED
jgi:hypothetical protein